MFNSKKVSYLLSGKYVESEYQIPLFVPDEIGPWKIRYIFVKQDKITNNYNSKNGSNIRSSTSYLTEAWRSHNALMINQCHLGNIIWRLKVVNKENNSVDMIEVWRNSIIIDMLSAANSDIKIEQATKINPYVAKARTDLKNGGTGLSTGSGLTINDPLSPTVYTVDQQQQLNRGLYESGFKLRTLITDISPVQAISIYHEFVELNSPDVTINTGWNQELNPVL